ncbi:26S proteasome regulatory subunit N1 [Exophiala viscosa]|uniref:26S proteasome regulatory subunit N1 n=1 Tax=Exophiala viscosa TaxID=2486360 RepID=A0AAN6DQA6_9EURO|nr:26S proteasome regulatory subunit N1 [Exophiala viscosa]KAI1624638.1 26S proteasome regulatory subunit N1 [Exophiala viscosa]
MAARSRFLPGGRDYAKKDDDMPAHTQGSSTFGSWKSFRRRRVILAILALVLLYLFFKNMPTDLPPISQRYDRRYGHLYPPGPPGPHGWEGQELGGHGQDQDFNGPISFLHLAKSMRGKATTMDAKGHVLFAISRLESIPRILPAACSMAQHNRTRVHVAFMGRLSADWADIKAINGISEADCDVIIHDARPDFPAQSSITRMDVSARASLGHIHSVVQLRAVLVGDSEYEEEHFVRAVEDKTRAMGVSLIALPANGLGGLSWISSLDGAALGHFSQVHVDIVIQARPESAAALMRLLRSIKEADYSGLSLPRLTIELPPNVDPFLTNYLANFKWPPDGFGSESRLVIRHRIDMNFLSPVQASMRTIESFYPLMASESHVLMLSPDAELSPGYFQLLMYTLFEYRYSARRTDFTNRLMGISLELPSHAPDMSTESPWVASHLDQPLVLWQAPNSNAALYFGDRWIELHSFLLRRLMTDAELFKKLSSTPSISHTLPAWLQPVLEVMQVRGYYMMYPTLWASEQITAVTMHKELDQSPEEYRKEVEESADSSKKAPMLEFAEDQPLTANDEVERMKQKESLVYTGSLVEPLLDSIPLQQRRRSLTEVIPLLSYAGEKVAWEDSGTSSSKFAQEFAQTIGGCANYDAGKPENGNVESLFCLAAG